MRLDKKLTDTVAEFIFKELGIDTKQHTDPLKGLSNAIQEVLSNEPVSDGAQVLQYEQAAFEELYKNMTRSEKPVDSRLLKAIALYRCRKGMNLYGPEI